MTLNWPSSGAHSEHSPTFRFPTQLLLFNRAQTLQHDLSVMTRTEAYVALNLLPQVGPVRVSKLLAAFGTPEKILTAKPSELARVEGISRIQADAIADWETQIDLAGELTKIQDRELTRGRQKTKLPDRLRRLHGRQRTRKGDRYRRPRVRPCSQRTHRRRHRLRDRSALPA